MSTSSDTTAPVKTSITTASSTTNIPTSTQTTPITSTTLPTTSESTTAGSTTTASSSTSTTTNNPTISAAVTSESKTLTSTTMLTSSETTAPVTTLVTTASSTTEIPTTKTVSTQTTPITSTTLPTTSESTTVGSTTTASSSTSTTTNNPTTSAAVTSESTTLSSTTMSTSSETTAPVTRSVTTASSTTNIPTSTQTTPITSTTLTTTSESTTAGSTTTASSSTSTTTNNPTTSAAVTSESTTLFSTTMSTSSETTVPVTTVTTASSTTNIPTSSQTTPITSTTLPTTSESTTAGSTTTASSTTSTTTNNPTTSGAVTSESTTLSSTTMSTSSETTAPVKTSITTASSTTDFPITKVVSTETTTVTSTKLPLTSESTTAETTSKTTVNPSSTAVTSESTTLTSTTMPTSSSLTPSEIKTMPTASTTAASTTTVGPSTTVASTSKTTTASSTSMASSAVIVPSSTSSSPTSSESPLQSSSTVFNPVPIRSTTSESTTAHTTSASATTLVPSTIKSAATSSEAPSTQTGETTMTFAATTSKTTTPPTISTTSESTPALVTTMPVSSSHVTILPTLTPTKTTESPRTPTVPITTTITTTATPPSSTAAQTTTQFQETSGDLLKTTVAFTSTSSAPATLALSTKTTSSPNMDSETTTALTTTTGIITGFTNTPEFPLVKPITSSPNTNTSTSPASTIPGHTSIKTIPAETLTSNTTPLNNTTKADATLQSTSSLQPETSNILKTFPTNVSGAATVTTRLTFSSLSSLPTETLVLGAVSNLLKSRESQLNESLKISNFTYQKISETSYAVILNIMLNNISMPEDPQLRNSSYVQVQYVVNNALNTLLNEPGKQVFEPKSSNFTSTPNQIDGMMDYSFQDGDTIQPVSFLKELLLTTTTTVLPQTTISFSMTPSNSISGSAVVTSKLVFNSSSPVPSEALVLSAINTLRNSRESQLNESVKVVNASYEKISETSYAVVFTFKLVNISITEDPVLTNNTYPQVQDVVNKALNTLLNEPGQQVFKPNSFNFTSTPNQIEGRMDYSFQDGDTIQPVSFLKELLLTTTTTVLPQTTTGFSVTPPNLVSGSAVVTSKLVFNSSSPVPSEALVLSAINTLRNSRESQLNESVKVVNVSYEKITATSYAVIFKLNLSNISMSKDPELRNGTYLHAQGVANNALNYLLNEPGRTTLNPKSANFISTSNQIEGSIVYSFQDGDAIQPVSFLNELRSLTVSTTTSTLTTTPQIVLGRALIFIRLVFVTLGPLPNPDKVLEVANTLLKTRITTKQDPTTQDLSDPVSFVNVTYTKINETAYALNFGFEISNITMNEKLELRNGTHLLIQDSVNTLLSKILLSNSSAPVIKFNAADFTGNSTVIQAKVEYVFSPSDITQPSVFVQELLQLNEATTQTTTSPPILSRRAIIRIRLEFITLGPRPSENSVLDVVKSVVATNLTSTLSAKTVSVSEPVTLANVNYLGINDTAYALIFAFEISKVSLTESKRNETYQEIQKKINNLVIQILKDPSINLLIPANFKDDSTMIEANVTYVFSQRESNTAAGFLVGTLFTVFTTPVPTTINTTISNNATNVAWIVAIIVPCAIIIGLVPCWILLCCLLCGCCAAIRRRWHRRRSYNVQYTTRNSLF